MKDYGDDQVFDWVTDTKNATRHAIDVNEAKHVKANAITTETALDLSALADSDMMLLAA